MIDLQMATRAVHDPSGCVRLSYSDGPLLCLSDIYETLYIPFHGFSLRAAQRWHTYPFAGQHNDSQVDDGARLAHDE